MQIYIINYIYIYIYHTYFLANFFQQGYHIVSCVLLMLFLNFCHYNMVQDSSVFSLPRP